MNIERFPSESYPDRKRHRRNRFNTFCGDSAQKGTMKGVIAVSAMALLCLAVLAKAEDIQIPEVCAVVTGSGQNFNLGVTYNGNTLYSVGISSSGPNDQCANLGVIKICVQWSNVVWNSSQHSGCAKVKAKVFGKTLVTVSLGCLNL
ncbi:hypothetical protein BaRGS_00017417 [Batillaria attramentaria]|uniref:DUF4773 domain-containing protein n=1 Tax=Batillaria attramentaria TaxID=370345 RepID=A0ABD0KWB1_9CAEN